MGKRSEYLCQKDAKVEELRSILMMPRDWLKRLDTWEEFKREELGK